MEKGKDKDDPNIPWKMAKIWYNWTLWLDVCLFIPPSFLDFQLLAGPLINQILPWIQNWKYINIIFCKKYGSILSCVIISNSVVFIMPHAGL